MDKQRKWFLEMESTPGKDAVKTADVTTRDLEYYIHLVNKAGFKRIASNFQRSSTRSKMLLNSKENFPVPQCTIFFSYKMRALNYIFVLS